MDTVYAGQPQSEVATRNQLGAIGTPVGRYRDVQALAAAGSVIGDAGAITVNSDGHVTVSAADGTKGVRLPQPDADGYVVHVKNNAAAVLKVWPHGATAINALSASAAMSIASLVTATFTWDATAAKWFSSPLLPS